MGYGGTAGDQTTNKEREPGKLAQRHDRQTGRRGDAEFMGVVGALAVFLLQNGVAAAVCTVAGQIKDKPFLPTYARSLL